MPVKKQVKPAYMELIVSVRVDISGCPNAGIAYRLGDDYAMDIGSLLSQQGYDVIDFDEVFRDRDDNAMDWN